MGNFLAIDIFVSFLSFKSLVPILNRYACTHAQGKIPKPSLYLTLTYILDITQYYINYVKKTYMY